MTFLSNTVYIDPDYHLLGRNTYDVNTSPSSQTKLAATFNGVNAHLGYSVSCDANFTVVGSPYYGSVGIVHVWNSNSSSIYPVTYITAYDQANDDAFGYSVAVGEGRIVVGAPGDDDNGSVSGSIYIYDMFGVLIAKVKPTDGVGSSAFGTSVAIGCGRIVVGAYGARKAYIFDLFGNQLKTIPSTGSVNDNFGASVAIGCNRIAVGAPGHDDNSFDNFGRVDLFDINGVQMSQIFSENPDDGYYFGSSVALGDGRIVIGEPYVFVGIYTLGAVHIYDLNVNLIQTVYPSSAASDDDNGRFGSSVAVGSGRIVVGQPEYATVGKIHVYTLDGVLINYFTSPLDNLLDYFGASVAVGGRKIVAGAYGENYSVSWKTGAVYWYNTPNQPHFLDLLEDY